MVGEILAGLVLGPGGVAILNFISVDPQHLYWLFQICLLSFLFVSGLELKWSHQTSWHKIGQIVLIGFSVSFISGVAYGYLGPDFAQKQETQKLYACLFMGIAFSICALPVLIRILADLNLINTAFGQTAVALAVVYELICWLFSGLLLGFSQGFWIESIKLYLVAGVFGLGFLLAKSPVFNSKTAEKIKQGVKHLIVPLFFISIGLKIDPFQDCQPLQVILVVGLGSLAAVTGNFLGGLKAGLDRQTALALAFVMNSRGAMQIVLASLGLQAGLIDQSLFTAFVIFSLLSSLVTPTLIKQSLGAKLLIKS